MDLPLGQFDHPAWFTGIATAISYGIVLLFITIVFFVVPLLIFMQL